MSNSSAPSLPDRRSSPAMSASRGWQPSPVASGERSETVDVLRGVAVLGILLLNVVGAGLGPAAYLDPTVLGGADGPNLGVWALNSLLFEGTMRGLLAILFGAGVILLTARAESRIGCEAIVDVYYRRSLWLIVFGLVHAYLLLGYGDVLFVYGLAGLLLYRLRRLSARRLLAAALAVLIAVPALPAALDYARGLNSRAAALQAEQAQVAGAELDAAPRQALAAWRAYVGAHRPPPEKVQQQTEGMRGGYASAWMSVAPAVADFHTRGSIRFMLWDALGTMLLGMALMKLGVLTAERSRRFYLVMLISGYSIGLLVNVYEISLVVGSDFDLLAFSQASLTYNAGRVPMTLGHVALIMLMWRLGWWRRLGRRLAAVGRTALTNYILQTLICNTLFVGFAWFGQLQRYQLYVLVPALWLVQLVASPVWLAHYCFGPLEWLWRSLSYGQWQPMRGLPDSRTPARSAALHICRKIQGWRCAMQSRNGRSSEKRSGGTQDQARSSELQSPPGPSPYSTYGVASSHRLEPT